MTTADRAQLVADLERDEGCELLPYTDTVGKLTVGIGRNLTDRGISLEEAHYLLQRDIDLVVADLDRALPWWREMTPARQRVLANMCFNMGLPVLLGFRNTLAYMERGNYRAAAAGMRASKWARQVGPRAERLARLMEG
jgi:lysozyme